MKVPRKIKKKIPKGLYCYSYKNGKYYPCPFHSIDNSKPEQENGYCSFLKKGDWNLYENSFVTDMQTGEKIHSKYLPFSLGLLWDEVKECNIKK